MNRLEEEEVKKLSEHIERNEMKDLTLLLRGEHSLSSFHITDHDRNHRLVIQHEMGRRWSLYFERLFRYVFAELSLAREPEFEVTDNVIALNVRE